MKSGEFYLKPVMTGNFLLDGGAMFGVVPKVLWSKTNPADENNRIEMAMRSLYIRTGNRKIIIDSGAGTKLNDKMIRNYGIESEDLSLVLRRQGIEPESITDVISTHLHFDHAGGLTYFDSSGEIQLTFPGAVHYFQKKQWEAGINPNEKDRASFFTENFVPVENMGKISLLNGEAEISDGIKVIPTEGHTPGHQVVLIETGEENLLYCGDLIPLASHVNLPYIMAYDHFPLSTLEEKRKFLGRAADENWILFFEHDPEISACRVRRNEKGRFEISEQVELE